jgi:hypothetical protein
VGLRIGPGTAGAGVIYRLEVEPGGLPAAFHKAIEATVRAVGPANCTARYRRAAFMSSNGSCRISRTAALN